MRDLRGPDGAGLCRAMRAALLRCAADAADVYGVPATKLRVFFHYQPQFYRLHAHCTRAEHTNPGCECDRAHLLTTVAANLDLAPDYYARAPLTYKLRVGEKLHGLLSAGAFQRGEGPGIGTFCGPTIRATRRPAARRRENEPRC